jgi:hypothetical protein
MRQELIEKAARAMRSTRNRRCCRPVDDARLHPDEIDDATAAMDAFIESIGGQHDAMAKAVADAIIDAAQNGAKVTPCQLGHAAVAAMLNTLKDPSLLLEEGKR